ncbi:zinc finger matrin-type protein 5 isoform X2 [Harpegnathos saltator]|uniref:zinc finger matrin-type protein 5 isoform X2 n=1 Tax=Harpegnathos saltator TaxID=610380 RepID=UPI00058BC869|nr:zinc finger matrin-type protein 5 isoform X2 [Harpegnathos saltator]
MHTLQAFFHLYLSLSYEPYEAMGKRYYCDYCDRSFKDDVEARRKHLSSLQHMKNRADHYCVFKDPETILREEYQKTPCKRYMTVRDCAFGLGCRFSHYTPQMIWELERLVAMKKSRDSTSSKNSNWPNSEDIIKEYLENVTDSNDSEEFNYPVWSAPSQLADLPANLPASLWPATHEGLVNSNFSKWG